MSSYDSEQANWFRRFEAGDASAWEELVDVFYDRLVRLAHKRMEAMPPAVADQEGAVISALRSFFSGVQNGQFSRIDTEFDLWRVLATITARKTIRQMRAYRKLSGEAHRIDTSQDIERLISRQISPDDEVAMIEDFQRRLDDLGDTAERKIVDLRLQGFATGEIAEQLQLHIRTVQRKLKLVQSKWNDELAES